MSTEIPKKERGTTFMHTQTYMSGSEYVDPSGNYVTFTLTDPRDSVVMTVSGTRRAEGIYDAYFSTNATNASLGVYVIETKAFFEFREPYPWGWKYDREEVEICHVV